MSVRRRSVLAAGVETSFLDGGVDSARTVLLLHDGAFGSDAESCWGTFMERLTSDYRVVAPDLLGYGGTRKIVAFDRDPIGQRLEHVRDFCAALVIKEPIAIGSSFGGGMVMRAAATRALPISAGVSIAGPGGIFMNTEAMAELQQYEPTEAWARSVCDSMVATPVGAGEVRDRLERSTVPGHYECLVAARVSSPIERSVPDWREAYKEALSTVSAPILLIGGEEDPLLEPDWAKQLAELVPTASVEMIPASRHQPHMDQGAKVLSAVRHFLTENGL